MSCRGLSESVAVSVSEDEDEDEDEDEQLAADTERRKTTEADIDARRYRTVRRELAHASMHAL